MQVSDLVHFLIALQLALGVAQFLIDFLNTVVDELLGLQGYLVLVGIGLTVVAVDKGTEEVNTALVVLVVEGNLSDIGLLGGGSHVHSLEVLAGHGHWGQHLYNPSAFHAVGIGHEVLGEGQCAKVGLTGGRELLQPFGKGTDGLAVPEQCAFYVGILTVTANGEVNAAELVKIDLVELVQTGTIQINIDGLCAVDEVFLHIALAEILGIELQIHHSIVQKDVRLQNLHLVLQTHGIGHEAQVLHIGQHISAVAAGVLVLLDQHTCRYGIGRGGVAEVDQCTA